jgi:hypothetical protein
MNKRRVILIAILGAGLSLATAFALLRKPTGAQIEACRVVIAHENDERVAVWRARTEGREPPEVDNKVRSLAACAPLFSAPACREAMVRFDEGDPSGRLVKLATACRDAYCPVLPTKPSICTERIESPSHLAQMWSELHRAMITHDLGRRAAPILAERERGEREIRDALSAYMDAGSPPWQGTHGTSIRAVPREQLPEPVREHVEQ